MSGMGGENCFSTKVAGCWLRFHRILHARRYAEGGGDGGQDSDDDVDDFLDDVFLVHGECVFKVGS